MSSSLDLLALSAAVRVVSSSKNCSGVPPPLRILFDGFIPMEEGSGVCKDHKGGYRLASKIKDKGFEADLYMKH